MTVVFCASVAAAAAVWLRRPDDWLVVGHRLGPPVESPGGWTPPTALLAVSGTCVIVVAVPSTPTQVAVAALLAAVLFAVRLHRRARLRAEAAGFRAEVARVVRATAAELRAGTDPPRALQAAADGESGSWATVRAAGAGNLVTALHAASSTRGGESLAEVAAAWQLAEQAGAPLAAILERMAGSIQDEVDLEREVAVEAGPARATARLMAGLPVFGLGLGLLLGVNPVAVLLGTGLGVACLVPGLALAIGGLAWIERIVTSVDGR